MNSPSSPEESKCTLIFFDRGTFLEEEIGRFDLREEIAFSIPFIKKQENSREVRIMCYLGIFDFIRDYLVDCYVLDLSFDRVLEKYYFFEKLIQERGVYLLLECLFEMASLLEISCFKEEIYFFLKQIQVYPEENTKFQFYQEYIQKDSFRKIRSRELKSKRF